MSDFAVQSFIKLELLGVTEVLKDLTVFIGNCNFHNGISFASFAWFFHVGSLHPAATAAVSCLLSSADAVVSPGDVQRFPVDKTRCGLAPCIFANLLHGRAGNVHLSGTLLVGLLLQVNQPNDLVFVQRQQDRLGILAPVGTECIDLWYATNLTAPWRSCAWELSSLCIRYIPIVALWAEKKQFFSKAATFSVLICVPADIRSRMLHVSLVRNAHRSWPQRQSQHPHESVPGNACIFVKKRYNWIS